MELMVIEVHGVPDILPHCQMVDQLKIHFLRRSNYGDDVLVVLFPTTVRGQAYIVFETAEAFGVLQHPHVLVLENRCYPLRVKRTHLSEVDMKAETTLNVNKFQRPQYVLQLLDSHGFDVTKLSHDHVLLKGSFLRLKLLHTQLIQLLAQDIQPHSRSYSSLPKDDTSEYVSQTERNSLEPRATPRSTSRYGALTGNDMQVQSWNSLSGASPPNLPIPKPSTLLYGDSGSGDSPRSLSCSCDDSLVSPLSRSCQQSSCSPEEVSFPVDTDILRFIYKQDSFKDIEKIYGTKMNLEDDVGFTTVTFWGKNCKKAEARLLDIVQQMTSDLRTQTINLANYDREQKVQICKRIQKSKDLTQDVMIKQDGDIVKVVGSSTRSFDMMQMLLGLDSNRQVHGHRGRNMERNSVLRRSSSLPRQYRLSGPKESEQSCSPVPEHQSSVTKEYSPSQYQEQTQRERTLKALGDSQQSPNKQAKRNRSSSEVRSKNMVTKEQLQQYDQVLPSGGETKSTKRQMPNIIKYLGNFPSKNILDIKQKLHPKNNN